MVQIHHLSPFNKLDLHVFETSSGSVWRQTEIYMINESMIAICSKNPNRAGMATLEDIKQTLALFQ